MRLKASRPIVYFPKDGRRIDLRPGAWTTVDDREARQLLAKTAAYLEIRQDDPDEPMLDPGLTTPPIAPGSVIAWFDQRKFTGGITQGDTGRVLKVEFDGEHWWLFTGGGWAIRGDQVFLAWTIDRDGKVSEPYRVRDAGLDGHDYQYFVTCARLASAGVRVDAVETRFSEPLHPRPMPDDVLQPGTQATEPRPLLADLPVDQQHAYARAMDVTPSQWSALTTGQVESVAVSPERPAPVASPIPSGGRALLTVPTVRGPRRVRARLLGPFAVHRSIGVRGYTLTHVGSQHAILSRIAHEAAACALAASLEAVADWGAPEIPSATLRRVRASGVLDRVPRFMVPLRNPCPETEA